MRNRLVFTLLTLCMTCLQAYAQNESVIRGRVTDANTGAPLPNVNITAKARDLPEPIGTVTDDDGQYTIAGLSDGVYEVTVTHVGYEAAHRSDVPVEMGAVVELDFSLAVRPVAGMEITVEAVSLVPELSKDAPAGTSVVDGQEVADQTPLNLGEPIKSEPGVDYHQTGLVTGNTVVRGFNNVFSGALLTLVDYRIGRVPSLRVNAHNFIPISPLDIERIEVVRGPASALYGPNSANGVMHIITRSPFDARGTTVSVGAGERSLRGFTLRHANVLNDKLGYRVSTQYHTGTDWTYVDPVEVELRGRNPRDYDVERRTAEFLLDFRPTPGLRATASAGFTEASNIELTGVGAAQAKDWRYTFVQGRLQFQELFAQLFVNRSHAGESTLLQNGDRMVDESNLTVFQARHASRLGQRQRFTYGFDVLRTRPRTEGTINGRNEDRDDINEFGFYLQSKTSPNEKLDLVLAGRFDQHNHIDDPVFSPRAALVLKPTDERTLRLTYNRAFSTPSSSDLFLDLVVRPDAYGLGRNFQPSLGFPTAIDIRAQAALEGFTFKHDANGLPMFRSPFAPVAGLPADQFIPLDDPQFTNVMWGIARSAVLNGFLPSLKGLGARLIAQQLMAQGMPAAQAEATGAQQAELLATAFQNIVPATLPGLQNRLATLNQETLGFDAISDRSQAVTEIPKIKPTVTETFEAGFKGLIGKKLLVGADLYRTRRTDFVGPARVETPNVFLDPNTLSSALSQSFAQVLQAPSAAQLAAALSVLDAPSQGGNGNGSAVDELTRLFVAGTANNGAAFIPFGTVSPEQASDPAAVVVTYRNFGEVTLYGLDLGLEFYPNHPNNDWVFKGNYSYLSQNLFENLDGIADVALNAPRHKFNIGANYARPGTGLRLGARVRYKDGFPMNSGFYVGDLEAFTVLDLTAAYDLPLRNTRAAITLNVKANNVLNNEHREFVGAPEIGRLVSGGITVSF